MRTHEQRLHRAWEVLQGLSVGDALGEAFSYQHYRARELTDFSIYRAGTVAYTDDTEMALGVYETLKTHGTIDEDYLAQRFTTRFLIDPDRGYGAMARRILQQLAQGALWQDVSPTAFGNGSFGNGAAMRVGPLGGYFADDLAAIPELAARSSRVTHYHPEGVAGAVAVALAVAAASNARDTSAPDAAQALWETVLRLTPESKVRLRLIRAHDMKSASPAEVAKELGCGYEVSAQDTVPFCLWSACRNLADYREAILGTVEVGGDCDTNAAIVGGIISAYGGVESIPAEWLNVREKLQLEV